MPVKKLYSTQEVKVTFLSAQKKEVQGEKKQRSEDLLFQTTWAAKTVLCLVGLTSLCRNTIPQIASPTFLQNLPGSTIFSASSGLSDVYRHIKHSLKWWLNANSPLKRCTDKIFTDCYHHSASKRHLNSTHCEIHCVQKKCSKARGKVTQNFRDKGLFFTVCVHSFTARIRKSHRDKAATKSFRGLAGLRDSWTPDTWGCLSHISFSRSSFRSTGEWGQIFMV